MVGARGFEPQTPLLPKYRCSLLTLILIVLTVTLVAYCVSKCQEVPIRLAQIWTSFLTLLTPYRNKFSVEKKIKLGT